MKYKLKFTIIIILIISICIQFCGCWNYNDIENLVVVLGLGVSKNPQTNQYTLTFEVARSMVGKDAKLATEIKTVTGDTIFDGIRNSVGVIGTKLYWGHAAILIISEEITKEGILQVLDMMSRSTQIRSDLLVAVTAEKNIKDIFKYKDPIHETVSGHLLSTFDAYEDSGKYVSVPIYKLIYNMTQNQSAVLPILEISRENSEPVIFIDKTAILKGEKMIGEINSIETRSLLVLRGEIKNKYVFAIKKSEETPGATVEVTKSIINIKPKEINNELVANIKVDIEAKLIELQSQEDYIVEKNDELQVIFEEVIKKQLSHVIKKTQKEFKVDIIGIGGIVRSEMPNYYKKIEKEWNYIFENMDINIEVNMTIVGSGSEMKPLEVGN